MSGVPIAAAPEPAALVGDEKIMTALHLDQADDPTKPTVTDAPISNFTHLTTNEAVFKFRRLFFTGLAATLGAMYIGYTGSAAGNIVANIGFIQQFGTVQTANGLAIDVQHISAWGTIGSVAQIVMQFSSPFVIDRWGRLPAMYILTLCVLIAIILEIVARDWKVYLVAKMFCGFASGWLGPSIMTYLSEICVPQFRGIILSAFTLSLALGQFTNSIACEVVNTAYPMEYRRVFYSEFVILGIWGLSLLILPESPVWLIIKGRDDQAKKSLHRLVGNPDGYDLEHEFAALKFEVHMSEEVTRSYSQNDWRALMQWGNLKRCLAASIPFASQQWCGVPYIFFYTTYFFQTAGLEDPFQGSVIISCVYIASIIGSFFLVERVRRRPLVFWGLAGLAVVNTLIGALGFIDGTGKSKSAALTSLCAIWMSVFGLSLSPVGWVGLVEVSSVRLRAKTAAFGVLINSFQGLVFTYTVPLMLSDQSAGWGVKIGLLFGGFSFAFLPFCWFYYPETKNRTVTQIDELYERKIPARLFHKTATVGMATANA